MQKYKKNSETLIKGIFLTIQVKNSDLSKPDGFSIALKILFNI